MKKITLIFICIISTFCIHSQVYVSENFDSGSPSGWTDTYYSTTTSPCSVKSERDNLYSGSNTGNMTTSNFPSVSNGTDLTFSIDYKILNYTGLGATAQGWGTATLQYSTDGGVNWIDVLVIDDSNHTTSTDCATASGTVAAVNLPIGSDVKLRISNVWTAGDYYFYIDNFNASQVISCPQVSNITASNITASSVGISWDTGGSETLWNVEYGLDGFTLGTGTGISASTNPTSSLSSLTSATTYDVYVQADCGGGDTSDWVGPVSFTTLCEAFDVPYTENFDSTSTGSSSSPTVPNCWSFIDGGLGYGYVSSTGANSFYIYNWYDTSGDYILVSPETNTLSSGTNRVSFDVDGSISQDLIVGTLSDPDDSSTFTAIETITLATSDYESYVVDIPAGTDSYIGFKHGQTGSYASYYLDNIAVTPQPSCLEVSDVVATTLTTGFDLSWTAGGIEPAWNIEYGLTEFTQGSGTTIVSSSTSATISGLLSNTYYDIYVQADCGGGDTSAWIGPLTVITNATCGDNLYDSGGSTGSYANNELTIVTVSPTNSGDLVTLTFNSFYTEEDYDKMWVYNGPDTTGEVLLNGVSGSSIPDPITSSHTTGSLTVKFDSDGSSTAAGYEIAVTCAAQPTCMIPSELSISSITDASAIFGWTSNGSEMAWNIEYGPSGFTQGAGTIVVANEIPYTFLDLLDNTGYNVYIQADCGVDGMSDWAGPVNFTTEPAPIVPDYTNDFSTFPGELWSEGSGGLNVGPTGSTSYWYDDGFVSGSTGSAAINLYSVRNSWLISPMFDLSNGTFFLNVDAAATEYNTQSTDAIFGADDFVTLMASTDGGSNWIELHRWDASNNPGYTGTGWTEITLNNYTATSKFAIYGESTTTAEDIDFFVDNFRITSTSLGIEDSSISLFNYFPNPVNDMLTIRAQKDVDDITVYNMLGQVVKRQSPNTRDCTVDLSAMQTGAYFVQVSIDNTVETVRILKN